MVSSVFENTSALHNVFGDCNVTSCQSLRYLLVVMFYRHLLSCISCVIGSSFIHPVRFIWSRYQPVPLVFFYQHKTHFSPILSHFRLISPSQCPPPPLISSPFPHSHPSSPSSFCPLRHFSSGARPRSPGSRSRRSRGAFPSFFGLPSFCLWP